MKIVSLKSLRAVAEHRPAGYMDEMLAAGEVSGDVVKFDNMTFAKLTKKYRPTLLKMGLNLAQAAAGWAASGFAIAPQSVYDARRVTCGQCPNYSADEFFHHCSICGCTGVKLHLATSKCPDNPPRWGAVSACISKPDAQH